MTSSNRHFRAVLLSCAALAALAVPAPLFAQAQSCPAGAPFEDPSVNASLLPAFNTKLSGAWPTAAAQEIDPLTDIPPFQTTASCDPVGDTACAATIVNPECEHVTLNMQLDKITGLSQLTFSDMTVQNFNVKEVAQHTQSGPDAGKITDGVFAPEGADWNHPSYTVVLTSGVSSTQFQSALLQSTLTIDLGSPMEICTGSQCGGATVQADRHSFALEYSTDGTTWLNYGTAPYKDSDGLHTRSVTIASSFGGQPVTAQYVRLYGRDDQDGDNNYSISEVELKDPQGKIISISTRAIGPRPYQIADGIVAPEGHTWNDPTYAAVLRSVGAAHALVIDLGAPVNLCGSSQCGPTVQADRHPFQFDYSQDGINWVSYSQLPAVSGSGLLTRSLQPIVSGKDNPNFTARYIRLYGLPADDDNYSISEVMLRNTATGNPVVSTGKLTYGPEALATDGEVAPEGADWNDPRYANILSPCGQSSNTICTDGSQEGLTGALLIDLGDVLTLSALQVQADRHQFQIDYRENETDAWQPLYTVPSVSADGLTTRPIHNLLDPQPQARYLMMYGTAGDDINYSVSSVQVYSDIAKTPCAYASGANAGQQYASCSYDGTMSTEITVPSGALATSFTIVSAEAYYHCTGAGSTDIPVPDGSIIGGTTCTGNLQFPPVLYPGGFCSATCGASTGPASVLTYADVSSVAFASDVITLTGLSCNHSTGNLTDAVQEVAAGTAATALEKFFAALIVSPLPTPTGQVLPPMIPSGTCHAPPAPPSNTQLRGRATHVGKADEAGRVRLRGAFSAPHAAPLKTLALELRRLLHEDGGVEELVRARTGVPVASLTLLPQKGSRAGLAVYATAPGVSPKIHAKVKKAKHGQLEFTLDVRGAHMPTLPTCTESPSPSVMLGTDFSLGTNGGPPIEVHALQDWQCEGKHRLTTP